MSIPPIRTEADYESALSEVERLLDAGPDTPEADMLDIWTTLVEAYEDEHFPIPAPDPIEAILYYLESRGLGPDDLEPYLGSPARVMQVLNRQQPLSLEMIRHLHNQFGISADVLIQPYTLAQSAA